MSAVPQELKSELLGILATERKEYEKQIEEKAKGIIDPIRQEVIKKLEDRYDELSAKMQVLTAPKPDQKQGDEVTAKLFGELMRKGQGFQVPADAPEAFKSIVANVDPQGGFLMPAPTEGRIVAKIYETSPMRQFATVQTLNGDKLEGLIDNDEADSGWVSEQGSRAETGTPELGKYIIDVHEQYAKARISQKALDDMASVEGWLTSKISDKFTRVENNAFFVGDGIGKPRGITKYTTAATADSSRAWGTIEHVATAANGAFPASNPGDTLIDVVYALKAGYRSGARWMAPKSVYRLIRKFKQSADAPYIWEPAFGEGQPARVLGYPIVEAEDMPALATDSLSLAFGDFRAAYTIVDRLGMRMLRDPYSAKPFVEFYAVKRTGGGVVNYEAIKFVKFGS
jgi:HK97 family phage major capsid protein